MIFSVLVVAFSRQASVVVCGVAASALAWLVSLLTGLLVPESALLELALLVPAAEVLAELLPEPPPHAARLAVMMHARVDRKKFCR